MKLTIFAKSRFTMNFNIWNSVLMFCKELCAILDVGGELCFLINMVIYAAKQFSDKRKLTAHLICNGKSKKPLSITILNQYTFHLEHQK